MKFSHRHSFDPEYKKQPIREDAPLWLRSLFFVTILDNFLYIDGDSRFANDKNRPLGTKALIERICAENGQETDHDDFDSYYCNDALKARLQHLNWFQFYDAVEIIGELLRKRDTERGSTWGKGSLEDVTFSSYRQKVNELFSSRNIDWKMNSAGHLETPLPNELEQKIDETNNFLQDQFEPARRHYAKARAFALGAYKDSENSIKESISAIESLCRTYYPSASTLGEALKLMKKESVISPMLLTIIEKFYAYTNAEPAVRHGSNEVSSVLEYDAEFVLHMSAAFIRTIIQRKTILDN
ncbi:hypothetical protein [Dickeya chrysanthemi]|uniref:hypothetical protein n=1 Tax=Dickeya chrysanthemi TaxID=556 RepID=UPI0003A4E229|nr:hypothetical protein [Dickeya chrysanthemi]